MIIAPAPEPSVLFSIPFASAMADADSARLAESLDLAMHMHPKVRDSPASPGSRVATACVAVTVPAGCGYRRSSESGKTTARGDASGAAWSTEPER